jgi:hypothetical protein
VNKVPTKKISSEIFHKLTNHHLNMWEGTCGQRANHALSACSDVDIRLDALSAQAFPVGNFIQHGMLGTNNDSTRVQGERVEERLGWLGGPGEEGCCWMGRSGREFGTSRREYDR